ncbi:Glutaredoxin 3 [Geranomyces variabilis]|uniref:Glutaredoxin 3 n=1 Tax=Geranomyces variabilis TaxID=109894 RepID=A0AAD5XM27_9FUNG|nr:Glutaredoxin 3 [Geranomyces variabilis]
MSKHNVNDATSDEHFDRLLADRSVSALNFWASWAEPCKDMNEVFEELSRKYPAISFIKLEAENYPDVSEKYEIAAVPTFIIVKNGVIATRIEGANAPALTAAVEKYAKLATGPASTSSNSSSSNNNNNNSDNTSATNAQQQSPEQQHKALRARLDELVQSNQVMVFIKGTPQQPRCGFSRQLVDLLGGVKVKYGSFNILADDAVRQGLKEYANWPTFPQVYVNGSLVGGLDIVKEMIESGEFQTMVPAEEDLNTRLKSLINKAPVMLFMKGDAETPRCGFSRQITSLLKENKVEYKTFDILEDDEVRQGLKTYSSWPTYPQLYIKGELVGGVDIVRELIESGEFKCMVE